VVGDSESAPWQAGAVAAVGVDACKGGWVALALRENRVPSAHFVSNIACLTEFFPDARVIAIDIPIGLPERGHRQADKAAKAVLGQRQTSVFMTPVRAALEASTHSAATAIATEMTGVGISQQAYALRSKIFEVEEWLLRAPCPVYEVHPEVSFTAMIGRPARAPKKSWHGMVERRYALIEQGIALDGIDPAVGAVVGVDDMIDAAAAAWSAARLLAGAARSFPDPPELDSAGRQIAIWA
jgi:predicted RNase H-like nuclease